MTITTVLAISNVQFSFVLQSLVLHMRRESTGCKHLKQVKSFARNASRVSPNAGQILPLSHTTPCDRAAMPA